MKKRLGSPLKPASSFMILMNPCIMILLSYGLLGVNLIRETRFTPSNRKTNGILDLIHSDLCRPMTASSMNGCLYYITFIDDCSRKTWIYFLKTKDESFSKFQNFKNLVENQTVEILRSYEAAI
jgi:hypothetical protein